MHPPSSSESATRAPAPADVTIVVEEPPSASAAAARPGSRAPEPERRTAPVPLRPDTARLSTPRVLDHPLAQHALTMLRNRRTPAVPFRSSCRQLLMALVHEAARHLPTESTVVPATVRTHEGRALVRAPLFISVTRAGMAVAPAVVDLIPGVILGSISLSTTGDRQRPEARLHLYNSPPLAGTKVFLFDPIIATGLSATLSLSLLKRSGANDISLLSFVSSAEGQSRIGAKFPQVAFWTGAIDQDWDSKLGPLPGIWNFSERACE